MVICYTTIKSEYTKQLERCGKLHLSYAAKGIVSWCYDLKNYLAVSTNAEYAHKCYDSAI